MKNQQVDIQEFENEIITRRSDLNSLISNKKIPQLFMRDKACTHYDIYPDLYAWAWLGIQHGKKLKTKDGRKKEAREIDSIVVSRLYEAIVKLKHAAKEEGVEVPDKWIELLITAFTKEAKKIEGFSTFKNDAQTDRTADRKRIKYRLRQMLKREE